MSHGSKTEKPTERRRQKAREQGQVPRSKDLSSTAAMIAGFLVLYNSTSQIGAMKSFFREMIHTAARGESTFPLHAMNATALMVVRSALLPVSAAWLCAAVISLLQGGFVFAPSALAPKLSRINPASKVGQLFSITALASVLRSLVPTAAVAYLCFGVLQTHWISLLNLTRVPLPVTIQTLYSIVVELIWKSCLVLLIWSVADYMFLRWKSESDLKMTRDEIREEFKQSEGNPQIKAKIRRLQRQVRRSRTLKDVAKATVVVVNPTHFAIALEYKSDMGAPVCVAKGRNLLALQIKDAARWHNIPIVENPPLAHALYRTVQLGQQIPSRLYQAVAEVLAMVFRMQSQAETNRRS